MGSSSIKLLILGVDDRVLTDKKIGARLGAGLGPDGSLPEANQERALAALRQLTALAVARGIDAEAITVIATAAVRQAPNGAAFRERVKRDVGLARARIIDTREQAELGYLGAIAPIRVAGGRYATLELGGGSFHLAVGSESRMEEGGSTPLGSTYVMEQLLPTQSAPGGGLALDGGLVDTAAFTLADAKLPEVAPLPLAPAALTGRTLVAAGGVARLLRAHLGSEHITRGALVKLRRQFGAMTVAERASVLEGGKSTKTLEALGLDTAAGAFERAARLPASLTLLCYLVDALGLSALQLGGTDARFALLSIEYNGY
jgi:exopolyphosphatase/pppGpp-phosphohydrolase